MAARFLGRKKTILSSDCVSFSVALICRGKNRTTRGRISTEYFLLFAFCSILFSNTHRNVMVAYKKESSRASTNQLASQEAQSWRVPNSRKLTHSLITIKLVCQLANCFLFLSSTPGELIYLYIVLRRCSQIWNLWNGDKNPIFMPTGWTVYWLIPYKLHAWFQ